MNLSLMKAWLTRWEDGRAQAYDDATGKALTGQPCIGNLTIGVGLNLKTAAACSAITALGLDFEGVLDGKISLTAAQVDTLLAGSINDALGSIRALLPAFDNYPGNQQLVLVDLTFNMGGDAGNVPPVSRVRDGAQLGPGLARPTGRGVVPPGRIVAH